MDELTDFPQGAKPAQFKEKVYKSGMNNASPQ